MYGMNEWISVQDRLPEINQEVLVVVDGNVTCGRYLLPTCSPLPFCLEHWIVGPYSDGVTSEKVTHWQELPPPPIGHQ